MKTKLWTIPPKSRAPRDSVLNDEQNHDQEIARLEKRRKILELRQQIAALEGSAGTRSVQPSMHQRRYDFAMIEGAIAKFSGDNSYGANFDWN